jgi:hypothetical protein
MRLQRIKKSTILFLVVGAAIMAVIFFGFTLYREHDRSTSLALTADEDGVLYSVPQTQVIAEGLRSYENAQFRFNLLFPQELQLRQYEEKGGAVSVTFDDPNTGHGFQIFVTPYAGTQITEDRFKLDQPSGIMDQPTDVMIDGVRATMFFSKNPIMGDVREVWFIKNGFLYEVVTYKELDEWLGNIMQSWKFI